MQSNSNDVTGRKTGEVEGGAALPLASPAPAQDAGEIRSLVFSALADVEERCDRRVDAVGKRIARLERRSIFSMPDEVRGLLVMIAVYLAISVILPLIGEWAREWRSRS
jgi:hypothetical protein